MTIRVLIVDDSAIVRQTLTKELANDPEIEIVGAAPDPFVARDLIVQLKPDVVTLDIEMPRMDGLSFLRKLMKHYPLPVIILSSLAEHGSRVALEALEIGAVEVMCKPGAAYSIGSLSVELVEKIKSASKVDMVKLLAHQNSSTAKGTALAMVGSTHKVLVVGSSTGGVQAIEELIKGFPHNAPGTVIVQHMPAGFTKAFADRLSKVCQVVVKEAENGESIVNGKVLIAPGGLHTMVARSGAQYSVIVKDGPLINRHKPSVEPLFQSAAQHLGANAIGVMLTGMGNDGAKAMLALREAGALTIAQDEKSCIVYGMPRAAIEIGAAQQVLPLTDIAPFIIRSLR
jgi:two-component system chemotaxis response regulator CheB